MPQAEIGIEGKSAKQAKVTLADTDVIDSVKIDRSALGYSEVAKDYIRKRYQNRGVAAPSRDIRHLVDWDTIYRYHKGAFKGTVLEAEAKAATLLTELRKTYRDATKKEANADYVFYDSTKAPYLSRYERLRYSIGAVFALEYTNPTNLFYGEASYNSSLGSKSKDAKLAMKTNWTGLDAQMGGTDASMLLDTSDPDLGSLDASRRYREALGRKSPSAYWKRDESLSCQTNIVCRLDLGVDDKKYWGLTGEERDAAIKRFTQMFPSAWRMDSKPGKYFEFTDIDTARNTVNEIAKDLKFLQKHEFPK